VREFKAGTSALLHIDWSKDSTIISYNTQAAELLFQSAISSSPISAKSVCNEEWATWTQKFGFPVQGIFQGVDFSDINTVCRDQTKSFLAVGYDDQTIRLFRYPCYIPKQIHKTYYGHSSHVTRIRFSPNYLISIGGEDKTIIVWNVDRKM
jgi:WD40 repeat protein